MASKRTMSEPETILELPIEVAVESGKKYWWCTISLSPQRGRCVGKVVGFAIFMVSFAVGAAQPPIDADGTIAVPAFSLPVSSLIDEEARAVLKRVRDANQAYDADAKSCPSPVNANWALMPEIRKCQGEEFAKTAAAFRDSFGVAMTAQEIGGVYTQVFTPKEGIAQRNQNRVLINLHGGHFGFGSRYISQAESVPISAVGKYKVISVDYRMAPEYSFPAASQDVAAVYREVLKTYKAENIGIFGCSAGGLLTAESIAWFQKEALPLPGAVGMFGGAASYTREGDSGIFAAAREGFRLEPAAAHPYFKGVDPGNSLAFPIRSPEVMRKFPPALLISTSRDLALSSVAHTHSELIRLGVDAELHVWEGMDHCFFAIPDLPQTREVNEVVTRFFDRHLGGP